MKTTTKAFGFLLVLLSLHNQARTQKFIHGQNPKSRIVGGFPAYDVSIPYIASIRAFGFHSCGGSILNNRTIITAAHCLATLSPKFMKVHVGDKTKSLQSGVILNVLATHSHPNWTRQTMDYDVALIRLTEPMKFNERVKPIPLAKVNSTLRDGSMAIVSGWGYTSVSGVSSEILRFAQIPIVNPGICKRLFGSIVTERMICAGDLNGGVDACQMDSGGPLVQDDQLIGIVSWGVGCALPNRPGVYSKISQLVPWINGTLRTLYNETI